MARGSEQWAAIQEQYNILGEIEEKSFAIITADQINQTQALYPDLKFEARLLTHFDNSKQLPDLFAQNGLNILPIQRGSYAVGRFNIFQEIEEEIEDIAVTTLPAQVSLDSLQVKNLANETMGLNYAFAHGITADFIGEELTASVAGRQKSGNWSYQIESCGNRLTLSAENAQIEIDAGYEGLNSIVLVEAKNSLVKQFCLRQLYFPFRCWLSKSKKEIRTIFAAINGGEVVLSEYAFPEPNLFKAELVRSMRYQIAADAITKKELQELIRRTDVEPEPYNVPFPQANSILRTIDLVEYLEQMQGQVTRSAIAEHYGFAERQGDYYGNSALYLGFVDRVNNGYSINANGISLVECGSTKQKHLKIIEAMLKRGVFRESIINSLNAGSVLPVGYIAPIIEKYTNLTKGTPSRRASTVRKWVNWVLSTIQD